MNEHFNDKVAVLTGAGGAIVGEIARSLAGRGVRVAIWDISAEAAAAKAEEEAAKEDAETAAAQAPSPATEQEVAVAADAAAEGGEEGVQGAPKEKARGGFLRGSCG